MQKKWQNILTDLIKWIHCCLDIESRLTDNEYSYESRSKAQNITFQTSLRPWILMQGSARSTKSAVCDLNVTKKRQISKLKIQNFWIRPIQNRFQDWARTASTKVQEKGFIWKTPRPEIFVRPWKSREHRRLTIVWPSVKQFRGARRHNKRSSTVDVTKMNCYIVLTNEGRPVTPLAPLSLSLSDLAEPEETLVEAFFACLCASAYYVSGPSLFESPSPGPISPPSLLLHPLRSSFGLRLGWFCGARAKHVFCQFLLFPVW